MRRPGLLVAVAIVLVANGAMLWAIRQNRTGPADAELLLTERELRLPAPGSESAGLALSLTWRRPNDVSDDDMPRPDWFDREKLRAIGFDCSVPPGDARAAAHYAFPRTLPREVYAVLEFRADQMPVAAPVPGAGTGAPGLGARAGTARLEPITEADRARLSRLAPIDVGADPAELRRRYPDRARYIVAPAMAELRLIPDRGGAPAHLAGTVTATMPIDVWVPKDRRALLDRLQAADKGQGRPWMRLTHDPRYQVALKYGSRLEPWVERVEPLGGTQTSR
jgi:hypothetical protein